MMEPYKPVYYHTNTYARAHNEWQQFNDSRKENIACAKAIQSQIANTYDPLCSRLNCQRIVDAVVEQFGQERVAFVFASTIQVKPYDGRFSPQNRAWAATVPSINLADHAATERDCRWEWAVNSHPALLDGVISSFRASTAEKATPARNNDAPEL